MARLLLGVSGGIAAYKALETARLAVKAGHTVRVIQTPTAERFVGRASFSAITGAPVLGSEFEPDPARGSYPGEPLPAREPISHLALVERAELYLIAPASANTIAKLAHGLADNLLSSAALASACPLALAPAMNNRMFLHAATQENLRRLAERGVTVIDPGEGELASHGEYGVGRLAEPSVLLAEVERLLERPSLAGVRVLVTAGGTREPLDSVRYLGNRSSGRMGVALAAVAARRGAQVTLVGANLAVAPPSGVRTLTVETAAELLAVCEREFAGADALLMAAAVADFRPRRIDPGKLKKDRGVPAVDLEPTADVLGTLGSRRRPEQVLVGFAAEHGEESIRLGAAKLERKGLDAIVVNDISRAGIGFDSAENEVTILTRDGARRMVPRADKARVAEAVLDELERVRATTRETGDGRVRVASGSAAAL